MTEPAGDIRLLEVERTAILAAAKRLTELAETDPGAMTREQMADAVGGLVAASEHSALLAGRYMDVGETAAVAYTKGQRSMTALVNTRSRISRTRCRQLLRAGALIHRYPHFHAAVIAGRITTGHVDVFLRVARNADDRQVAAAERDLAALAVLCTPEEFRDHLAIWEAAADPDQHLDEFLLAQARRNLSWGRDLFGNYHLQGTLEPIAGEQIVKAILDRRQELTDAGSDAKGSAANHDALVDLVLGDAAANAHIEILTTDNLNPDTTPPQTGTTATSAKAAEDHTQPPTTPVSVPRYRDTGFGAIIYPQTTAGTLIPPAILREMAASGRVRFHALHRDGTLKNDQPAGRRFTTVQRRMIRLRDHHCKHAGCRLPVRWTETDHITPFENSGPSLTSNGQLLCKFHHRWKHRNDRNGSRLFEDSPLPRLLTGIQQE